MDRFRPFLARAASVAAILGICGISQAGSLEPPPGPAAPTMKTLAEVEARTPIHQSNLPMTISVDGAYYLAENVHANQNGVDMITITAHNVSIDLNGFTVDGTGQPGVVATDCIQIEQEVRTFALSNGTIRGCGQNGVLTNFNLFGMTFTVDRVQANQNGGNGVLLGGGAFGVISRSVANNNVNAGIFVNEGVITECAAFNNAGPGLEVVYGAINNCVARSNGLNAITFSGGVKANTYAP